MSFPDITAELSREHARSARKASRQCAAWRPWTWFKTGGPAQAVFQPDEAEISPIFSRGSIPKFRSCRSAKARIFWCATAALKASSSRSGRSFDTMAIEGELVTARRRV